MVARGKRKNGFLLIAQTVFRAQRTKVVLMAYRLYTLLFLSFQGQTTHECDNFFLGLDERKKGGVEDRGVWAIVGLDKDGVTAV